MKIWQVSVLVCASLVCLSACKNQTTSEADKQNGDKQTQVSSQTAKKGKKFQTLNSRELMVKLIAYQITKAKRSILNFGHLGALFV